MLLHERHHRSPTPHRSLGLVLDLVHFQHDVARKPGLGEEHIHVPGQPARDWVHRESHLLAQVPTTWSAAIAVGIRW